MPEDTEDTEEDDAERPEGERRGEHNRRENNEKPIEDKDGNRLPKEDLFTDGQMKIEIN